MLYNQTVNDFQHCPTEGAIGLLSLLIKSGRLAESRLDDALATVGLTFVKWRALDTLVKAEGPIPLKLLPGELHCVKSNVTQLVDKLEAENLVRRSADKEDRRSVLVEVTEPGRNAHKCGRAALEAATQKLFEAVSPEDQSDLRRLLRKLHDE
jgi:DNA-binding MarR family transcriptional regulator